MAGREYARDANGKFASKGSGGKSAAGGKATRSGNLTKRIQLRDAVGQKRRQIMQAATPKTSEATAAKLRALRAGHREAAKKLPVIRKPKS